MSVSCVKFYIIYIYNRDLEIGIIIFMSKQILLVRSLNGVNEGLEEQFS